MRIRYKPLALITGLGSMIAGATFPPPPLPKAQKDAQVWSIPDQAAISRFSPDDIGSILNSGKWNDGAGSTSNAGTGNWRLAGIVMSPKPYALFSRDGTTSTSIFRVAPGGEMPDGNLIVGIKHETVNIRQGSCEMTYKLHAPASPSACDAVPDANSKK